MHSLLAGGPMGHRALEIRNSIACKACWDRIACIACIAGIACIACWLVGPLAIGALESESA